jgi:hypothetical protein
MYRTLRADKIIETAERLRRRISERFPDAGLAQVAGDLCDVAEEVRERCRAIRRPHIPLRVGGFLLVALGVVGIGLVVTNVKVTEGMWRIENFLEEFDAALGSLVFMGAAVLFLVTLEIRIKRRRALAAIHELRALAHIVDMHQLTKDPEPLTLAGPTTESSPKRTLTPFELNRYFDYCSELLSILGKLGALYVQDFPDPVALNAVDEVETLTTGLSRKIWQKIVILDRYTDQLEEREEEAGPKED